MKLRMALSNIDLAERFNILGASVANIISTWINYLCLTLCCLKIWPHSDVIDENSSFDCKEKYPTNVAIIDAPEIKVQTPSALQKHSETHSTYKCHTTFKSLIRVDPKGGMLFVSHLYEGSISDKELVKRCGLLQFSEKKYWLERS